MRRFFLFCLFFGPIIGWCQNLSITEVYYDGTNERLEIYNNSQVGYSGSLVLTGGKSTDIILDVSFTPYGYIILGDSPAFSSSTGCVVYTGVGLSLIDTKEVGLGLSNGSGEQNYFISEEIINDFNDEKKSLIFDGVSRTGSSQVYTGEIYGSPCSENEVFFEENIQLTGLIVTGSISSGENLVSDDSTQNSNGSNPPNEASSITQEDSFNYGDIVITEIQPYDNDFYSEYIRVESFIEYVGVIRIEGLGQGSASKSIDVKFEHGGVYYFYDGNTPGNNFGYGVDSISLKNSGEKVSLYSSQGFLFDTIEYGTIQDYLALHRDAGDNAPSLPLLISPLDYPEYREIVGINNEINNEPLSINLSGLFISEIYPFSGGWGEYMEIGCRKLECKGTILSKGLGRGEKENTFSVSLLSGEYLTLVGNNTLIPPYVHKTIIDGFSLADGGEEIILFGQDGQLIDSVVYSGVYPHNSEPSPGTDGLYCLEEETLEVPGCGIIIQNKKGILFPKKINLITELYGKTLSNSSPYACRWNTNGKIEDGELIGCNPGYINFEEEGLYDVGVEILKEGKVLCDTSFSLNYPKEKETEPNRTNYYKGLYNKRKEKYTKLQKETKNTQSKEETSNKDPTGNIIIISLLPNPQGKDEGNEKITLKNVSKEKKGFQRIFTKRNGVTKTITTSIDLPFGLEKSFFGSFGLVNKASCIELWGDDELLDNFCYGDVKEDEEIFTSLSGETKTIADVDNYGISITLGSVCIEFEGQPLFCKDLPYNIEEVKVLSKEHKALMKIEQKYTELKEKIDTHKTNEKKLRKQRDEYKNLLSSQIKEYKKKISITNDLLYTWKHNLISQRPSLYYEEGFDLMFHGYKSILGSPGFTTYIGKLPIQNIKERKYIMGGKLPLESYSGKQVYQNLGESLKNSYRSFLQNITQ